MTLTSWFLAVDIVHDMPGRSASAPPPARGAHDREALEYAVVRIPGVTGVRINPRARSLVVTYDPGLSCPNALRSAVAGLAAPVAAAPFEATSLTGKALARKSAPAGDGKAAVLASLATLLGTGFLPWAIRLPVALAAAAPR